MDIQRFESNARMSQAVVYGGLVYFAGQVGAGETVAEQTTNVLASIDRLLAAAGSDRSRILTATIWLTDMATFGEMNGVWEQWVLPGSTPARATVASLAVVAIALIAWSGWNRSGRQEASFASRTGELKTIALADGSSATLSSASQIDVVMTRDARSVTLLRGEAYFEVAHDAARPFSVSANDHQVVAVGTRFSVRRDARNLRVVVTEGKVRLDSPADAHGHDGPSTFLPAGSIASAGPNGVLVRSLSLGEAERHLEWRSGFLAFDDTALVDAVAEFNRFSLRKIELGDSGVALLRIGGNFRWDNSDGFVSLLEHGFPVRVERKPDRIVLHSP